MKQLKLERGKEELISTGGNYLCGHILRELAREQLPEDFQLRREGAISDRDVLLTMTGMLCDGRSDFTNVNQYFEDTVFTQSFETRYGVSPRFHDYYKVTLRNSATNQASQRPSPSSFKEQKK